MSVTVLDALVKMRAEGIADVVGAFGLIGRGADDTGRHVGLFGSATKLAFAAAGAAALAGVVLIVKSLGDMVQEGMAANVTMAQTTAVLTSTKGVAGVTADAVTNLAEKYMNLDGINDDVVRSTENLLLTFTSISKDIFPQATQAALDVSVALNEDLKNATIQVGKALQDPITGLTNLRRVGVQFDQTQRDLIKTYMEHGEKAKAQAVILAELNKEFGGSAAAAGQANGGIKILGAQFDNMKQTIGQAIVAVLLPLAVSVMPHLRDAIGWVSDKAKGLPDLFKQIGDFLRPLGDSVTHVDGPMRSFGRGAQEASDILIKHKGILSQVGDMLGVLGQHLNIVIPIIGVILVAAFVAWAAAATAAAIATIAATWPVLAIIAAIALLAAGLVYAYTHWGWFKASVDAARVEVGAFIGELGWLFGKLGELAHWIGDNIMPKLGWLKDRLGDVAGAVGHARDVFGTLTNKFGDVRGAIDWLISKIRDLIGWLGSIHLPDLGGLHLPGFAAGGVMPGGAAIVGEEGPELALFPAGTRIIPASQTAALMSGGSGGGSGGGGGGGGGGDIVIHAHWNIDGREVGQSVVRAVRLATGQRV
jgi:uncharacterized membrane protein YgcG